MTDELLFVYGALLSPSYFSTLVPGARFVCIGEAQGWQLETDGTALIVIEEGATTFGALYSATSAELRTLDRAADPNHTRSPVRVITEHGEEVTAHAYVATAQIDTSAPRIRQNPLTSRYQEAMESGYGAHNAPDSAWERLRAAQGRAIAAAHRRAETQELT